MSRKSMEEEVVKGWKITLDRVPQLQRIAAENNLDSNKILTYEALYYLMYQWDGSMTREVVRLDDEVIRANEIARKHLKQHTQQFIETREIPSGIKAGIRQVATITTTPWTSEDNLTQVRSELRRIQDSAQRQYHESDLYADVLNYCNFQHGDTIDTAWNTYLLTTYNISNFLRKD